MDVLYVPTADTVTSSATEPTLTIPDNAPAVNEETATVLSYSLLFVIAGSAIVNWTLLIVNLIKALDELTQPVASIFATT